MTYAIIKLAGKQFKVQAKDTITVNQLDTEEGKNITVKDVLLVNSGDDITVGSPTVKDAAVTLKVVKHQKGDKVRVAKYKSKSRYRKIYGHRQPETVLEVTKISI